jgi:energy-coupling factor transporter transmembrane protein EcfT
MTETRPDTARLLDPRAKFVSLLLLSLITFIIGTPTILLGIAILSLAFATWAGVRVSRLVRRLNSVTWFVIIITGTSLFTVSGTVLFEVGGLFATAEGATVGLVYSGRVIMLLWLSTLFVWTTSVTEMIDGVAAVSRRFRGSGSVVVFAGIAITFVPLLVRTAHRIRLAQIARGAPLKSGFVSQMRFAGSAAMPLIAAVIRTADDLALAMESRCFNAEVERSHYRNLRFQMRDWVAVLVTVCVASLSLFLHVTFPG